MPEENILWLWCTEKWVRLKDIFLRKIIAMYTALAHQLMEKNSKQVEGTSTAMKIIRCCRQGKRWDKIKVPGEHGAFRTDSKFLHLQNILMD